MSNIGEELKPKAWLIILETQDGSMATRSVPSYGDSLSVASEAAEDEAGAMWFAVAGRLLR